jgi:hypothetical protein
LIVAAIAAAIIALLRRRYSFRRHCAICCHFSLFAITPPFHLLPPMLLLRQLCFRCCISLDVTPFLMAIRRAPLFFAFICQMLFRCHDAIAAPPLRLPLLPPLMAH